MQPYEQNPANTDRHWLPGVWEEEPGYWVAPHRRTRPTAGRMLVKALTIIVIALAIAYLMTVINALENPRG